MNTDIFNLTNDRTQTHGDFTNNSRVSQALKSVIQCSNKWTTLSTYQKEALEMIMHKVSRIVEGDPNIKDHWDDIAGYAKLVSDRINPASDVKLTNVNNSDTITFNSDDTIVTMDCDGIAVDTGVVFHWEGLGSNQYNIS